MNQNLVLIVFVISLVCPALFGAQPVHKKVKGKVAVRRTTSAHRRASATRRAAAGAVIAKASLPRGRRAPVKRWVQTWDEPTYKNSTSSDNPDGEDLVVRKAAADALGDFNGSIVVVDPSNGRILSMVNQKLALGSGFQPCSTIKVSVALAALREKVIERSSPVHLYGRTHMDLTNAIAHSNNYYFANLGVKLGYERVNYYAHLFGYGEKAGLNIPGEQAGYFPPAPPKNGGMGMLTSFGEEIEQTPLELAGLMTAIANGGTLYYLQYPRTPDEIKDFSPQVKRHLDIGPLIPEIKPGMQGAVEFGTARRAKQDETLYGKTGTCSEGRTRLGWFGSFNEVGKRKLVVVVLLTGGRPSIGPMAAGVAGDVYRNLASQKYFQTDAPLTPAALISSQICCTGR
ncbi:MAG: penicillin-binding protein transpeptidase [Bryobacterales bacterium]|nr:penicillin-binding protein transpeptidase [Bryobacterales bacterium]